VWIWSNSPFEGNAQKRDKGCECGATAPLKVIPRKGRRGMDVEQHPFEGNAQKRDKGCGYGATAPLKAMPRKWTKGVDMEQHSL
jgi:hypothetical protein